MANEQDKILDHEYDGIQEYDNDLPIWWRNIFIITTIFAVFYVPYVHLGFSEASEDKLARQMAELEEVQSAAQVAEAQAGGKAPHLLALVKDESNIATGEQVFAKNCAACHAANGAGMVGPNLIDAYWIHGGAVADIYGSQTEFVGDFC